MIDLNRLNKEQREAAEHIEGPLLVMAGAGTGKALANNTKVLTDKGYIPIGILMINDKVYGKDGELHNVIGVFPQGKKKIWKITFEDETVIQCCKDHLWEITDGTDNYVITTMEMFEKFGEVPENVSIPVCAPINFSTNPMKEKDQRKKGSWFPNILVHDELDTYLFVDAILNECLFTTIETREKVLLSLLNKRTKLKDKENTYELYSVTREMAEVLQFFVEHLGGFVKVTKQSLNNKTFYKSTVIMNRARNIVRIEETEEYEEMTCIKVDAEDYLFVIEHCVLTHNTSTMTYRVANMIEKGIPASEILLLTFTNKAANEMKDRICSMLDSEISDKILACTFHSFCTLMLRKYASFVNISPNFTIISPSDDADIVGIVKANKDINSSFTERGFPPNAKVCDFISKATNKKISITEAMAGTKYTRFVMEVEEIKKLTESYRRDHDMLNYDEILTIFLSIIEKNEFIARKVAEQYKYIVVDEYQDTNSQQEDILLNLYKYTKNIAVVGDDMQSLYGFRGAEVENILHFHDKFVGCKIVELKENYRSSQEILDFSNNVCKHATVGTIRKLHGQFRAQQKPKLYRPYDGNKEADVVVSLIRQLRTMLPDNEICVVARNSMSSAQVEVMLTSLGIPFDKYGGAKYTDLSYVKDILAYLKLMVNNKDEVAMFRVLQILRGIGTVTARKIAIDTSSNGIEALTKKKYKNKAYSEQLEKMYNVFKNLKDANLQEALHVFIHFYHNIKKENIDVMNTDEGNRTQYHAENDSHYEDLQKLKEIAKKYKNIASFLDDLLLDNTTLTQNKDAENLVISTIHSVKGLEYQAVIVLDCTEGIFPVQCCPGSKEDNDELRCFYVAITRAKRYLYIMSPRNVMTYGRYAFNCSPSHYLLIDDMRITDSIEQH